MIKGIKDGKKISQLQAVLTITMVVALVTSNIAATKLMQLPFGFVMNAGMLVFPVTYIISDVFCEVYGYRWSRITCYLAFCANLFVVGIFMLAIIIPPASFWDGQEAMEQILGNTPRILLASSAAFVLGDLTNDRVFRLMKKKHMDSHKRFPLRAMVSSFLGSVVDSAVFLPIAFLGVAPAYTFIPMAATLIVVKMGYELMILPITRTVVHRVSRYEKEHA